MKTRFFALAALVLSLAACTRDEADFLPEGAEGIVTEVTKVDGTSVTWQKAVDAMNTALQNAGSEWRYELTGALPNLKMQ